MKTLHVTNRIYPEFNGGTEIHIYDLCQALAKKGEKTIIFTQETVLRHQIGIKKYSLLLSVLDTKKKLLESILFKQFRLLKLFNEVLKKEKPDIVHLHHLIDLSPLLLVICWYRKIPHLLDLVDYWFLCPGIHLSCGGNLKKCATECVWKTPKTIPEVIISRLNLSWPKNIYGYSKVFFHRLIWKTLLNHTNTILIANSERTKEIHLRHGVRGKQMIIKPVGIRVSSKIPRKIKHNNFNIAYLGAILPIKGVSVLVSAFKKLPQQNLRLILFGQNSYPGNTLIKQIASDARISLESSYDHNDLGEILEKIDLIVVPSIWEETFSMVISEALSARIPIIATKIGAMPERIIDGVNGFLVKPNNAKDLAEKIKYVVRNYRRIQPKLDYRVGQFKLEQEVRQVITLYNSIAKK